MRLTFSVFNHKEVFSVRKQDENLSSKINAAAYSARVYLI